MRTAKSRVRAQVRVIGKATPLYSGWRRPPAVSNLLYTHAMPLFGLAGGKRKVHQCTERKHLSQNGMCAHAREEGLANINNADQNKLIATQNT